MAARCELTVDGSGFRKALKRAPDHYRIYRSRTPSSLFCPKVLSKTADPHGNLKIRGRCEYFFHAEWFSTVGIVSFDRHCYSCLG